MGRFKEELRECRERLRVSGLHAERNKEAEIVSKSCDIVRDKTNKLQPNETKPKRPQQQDDACCNTEFRETLRTPEPMYMDDFGGQITVDQSGDQCMIDLSALGGCEGEAHPSPDQNRHSCASPEQSAAWMDVDGDGDSALI